MPGGNSIRNTDKQPLWETPTSQKGSQYTSDGFALEKEHSHGE